MDLLLRVFNGDEINVEFCWVKIIPEAAETILQKLKFVRDAKARDKEFHYAAFDSCLPDFYRHADLCDAGFGDQFLEDVDDEEWKELTEEEALLVGVAVVADTDTKRLMAWPGHVSWTAWEETEVEVETASITERIIEDVAHQDPKHLLKMIAFAPKVEA